MHIAVFFTSLGRFEVLISEATEFAPEHRSNFPLEPDYHPRITRGFAELSLK
jgi:hypothetical protein